MSGRLSRKQRQQDSDQPANDMCIAVAHKRQYWFALFVAPDIACKPDLAGAALNLCLRVAVLVRQWRKCAAELDHVAVAIVPLVEQREIVLYFVDRRNGVHII